MEDHGQANKGRICLSSKSFINKYLSLLIESIEIFRSKRFGLNTYMYAPKDDFKHRVYWRELYSVE